jgi:putative glutamine amidotransferase
MATTLPFIGVTSGLRLESERQQSTELYVARRYLNALEDAGGLGVPLPILRDEEGSEQLLNRLDGLLLTGGADIPPDYYGEERRPETKDLPRERVDFELALVRRALELDKPLLAICYGHQLLCVALGGTLYQHIGGDVQSDLEHRPSGGARAARHLVTVTQGRLARIVQGETCEVPSSHHQCVKEPPTVCEVTARAPDGIIEALEHKGKRFALGVQWHPELARQDPWSRRLFDAFVRECVG